MLTIKGKEWHLVRPSLDYQCKVYKNERPAIKYSRRSKRIKENCGKVVAICIRLINGEVFSLERGTHMEVCEKHDISTHYVKDVGWKLDNGNFVWR